MRQIFTRNQRPITRPPRYELLPKVRVVVPEFGEVVGSRYGSFYGPTDAVQEIRRAAESGHVHEMYGVPVTCGMDTALGLTAAIFSFYAPYAPAQMVITEGLSEVADALAKLGAV